MSAASSARVAVQPVGFDGDTTNRARVRAPAAPARRSRSTVQPALPKVIGTSTGLAPMMPAAAAAFGQVGVGMRTSSPTPAVMARAIWIACMPEPVTKNSSGEKSRP
jgi:hypothetical protein